MKILYLDCQMGAAGDMFSAALLDLLADKDVFVEELNDLGLPGIVYRTEPSVKAGITGTHLKVLINGVEEGGLLEHDHSHDHHHHSLEHEHSHDHHHSHEHEHHHHHHAGMEDIAHIVSHFKVPDAVKEDVLHVYGLIAEAESAAHGMPVTEIHFHEVGTMDAVADVTAACMLVRKIAPDKIVASPVCTGFGSVHCAHGILPVPAPATAFLLKGIPVYSGQIEAELCTPTGAALLKYFVTEFAEMPVMTPEKIGYGMGGKDFPKANCLRAILGEAAQHKEEEIVNLSCNVDDMTAEEIGFAIEALLKAGAKDAFSVPCVMKKSRPGTLLCALCSPEDKEAVLRALFQHTTTLGVRESVQKRYVLDRRIETEETGFGPVRKKISSGYGVVKEKYEYEDLAAIASEQDFSLYEVKKQLEK